MADQRPADDAQAQARPDPLARRDALRQDLEQVRRLLDDTRAESRLTGERLKGLEIRRAAAVRQLRLARDEAFSRRAAHEALRRRTAALTTEREALENALAQAAARQEALTSRRRELDRELAEADAATTRTTALLDALQARVLAGQARRQALRENFGQAIETAGLDASSTAAEAAELAAAAQAAADAVTDRENALAGVNQRRARLTEAATALGREIQALERRRQLAGQVEIARAEAAFGQAQFDAAQADAAALGRELAQLRGDLETAEAEAADMADTAWREAAQICAAAKAQADALQARLDEADTETHAMETALETLLRETTEAEIALREVARDVLRLGQSRELWS